MPLAELSSEPPSPYLLSPVRQGSMSRSSLFGFGGLKSKFGKSDKSSVANTDGIQTTHNLGTNSPPTRRPDRPGMNAFTTPSTEPPPAYSAVAPSTPNFAPVNPISTAADDRYAFLSSFDTMFLIDDSGSMAGRSWRETATALEAITPICVAHDSDGIDIHFLNAKDTPLFRNVRSAAAVRDIFRSVRPQGGTPTGQRLNQILKPYLRQYEADPDTTKPLNIIVITDGAPSDDVESTIIAAAKKLDKLDAPAWQVGIQFFQVGQEPGASEHLQQLDDELASIAGDDELRDMVDTVPFLGTDNQLTADGLMKIVLGSVNRRLDRRSA